MSSIAETIAKLNIDTGRLAKRARLSRTRLDQILHGSEPSTSELLALSSALKLSVSTLLSLGRRSYQSDLRFRSSQQDDNKTTLAQARIISILDAIGDLARNCPRRTSPLVDKPNVQDGHSVEGCGRALRRLLNHSTDVIGPIGDLALRIEQARLAHVIKLRNLTVPGAAIYKNGSAFIFVATQFPSRTLFSVAHELVHFALDHVIENRLLVDADTIGSFRQTNDEERLSDAVAAALLMPAEGIAGFLRILRQEFVFRSDAISDTEIQFISHYFGTSFLATAFRLEQIGLLPRGAAIALERRVSRDFGNPEKQSEKLNIPKRTEVHIPTISNGLKIVLRDAVRSGEVSLGKLADAFSLTHSEIQDALT